MAMFNTPKNPVSLILVERMADTFKYIGHKAASDFIP